jgi:hypothetical protein
VQVHPYKHRGRDEEGREPEGGRGRGEKKARGARHEEGGRSPPHVALCPGLPLP